MEVHCPLLPSNPRGGSRNLRYGAVPLLAFPSLPPLPSPPIPLRSRDPLNQLGDPVSAVSSPSGVRGGATPEKELGALQSCQKATGGVL